MPTPSTLNIALQNRTNSNTVYAYITGRAPDHNNALFILQRDGITPYYPTSPPEDGTSLEQDCAIRLGAPDTTTTVTTPHLDSARIWFSVDGKLTFKLNRGPALVEPSVSNRSDPNIDTNWGFAEFTYNNLQLYANITYVDFVSVPISLTLTSTTGATQHVTGMPANGLDIVCAGLRDQDARDNAGWSSLVVRRHGRNLRALSPNIGIVVDPLLFKGYFEPYVDQVWHKYVTKPLSVNTQTSSGVINGQVIQPELILGAHAFSKPSTRDIFSCSTGPFEERGSAERGNLIARLSAALNRSTILVDDTIPDTPPTYFQHPITNHYARIVHDANLDGRGYAFPYDDVTPTGGRDQSGAVNHGSPRLLTVAVGGNGASLLGPGIRAEL
ncbi:hypothetical protein W97_08412 [Coniosporium apollinis CBS 100218]|uniref:GH64 domain-containing protein n=1 Tax=Coniosporium apollinis (strain CBS 100218) TaxID=1168221 RepID=R7Z533_CONA1|nr:uncharacterized protein W97_08412 [Coniosporium apollinis CBS 100218]EON69099.1 hypothetical protein W97_08412 [Coniosporium apollinis CBS 100218]